MSDQSSSFVIEPSPKRFKIEESLSPLPPDLSKLSEDPGQSAYLSFVTDAGYWGNIIKTSNVDKLLLVLNENSNVVIEGPKGSGKTCLCATVYEMLAAKGEDCIFLTSKSFAFKDVDCRDYFTKFYKKHRDCFDDQDEIDFSGHKHNLIATVATLITRVRARKRAPKSLNVFLDLSAMAQDINDASVKGMIDIASKHLDETGHLVMSVSSGVKQLFSSITDAKVKTAWLNTYCTFAPFVVNGFTKEEAREYFARHTMDKGSASNQKQLTFDDVYPHTGCNPLLLHLILGKHDLTDVINTVESVVDDFIVNNLKLSKSNDTINQYLLQGKLKNTIRFAQLATWGGELKSDDEACYKLSWLALNHVAVLRTEDVETLPIPHDQDDIIPAENAETTGITTKQILRWNFPCFGKKYIDILNHFVTESDSDRIKRACRKEPSLAGFWFESMFFNHHRYIELIVQLQSPTSATSLTVEFTKFSVLEQTPYDSWEPNVLFELKSGNPIIDGVGLLDDKDGRSWFVFIQISLQKYQVHRKKLSELFSASSHNPVNKSWSLYTHYRHQYGISYADKRTRVMLLYISPTREENFDALVNDAKKVKITQPLFVAELSNQASFYSKMIEFEKNRKHW